ncbi:hypothetical protein LINPERPRIM_LOCUS38692 [Linum perenne]
MGERERVEPRVYHLSLMCFLPHRRVRRIHRCYSGGAFGFDDMDVFNRQRGSFSVIGVAEIG